MKEDRNENQGNKGIWSFLLKYKSEIMIMAAIVGIVTAFLPTFNASSIQINNAPINIKQTHNSSIINNGGSSSVNNNNVNIMNSNNNNKYVNHNVSYKNSLGEMNIQKKYNIAKGGGTIIDNGSMYMNTPNRSSNIANANTKEAKKEINELVDVYKHIKESLNSSTTKNNLNSNYPIGWYGFQFPSKYEDNFKDSNIRYTRLNTNKGTFNDLCKSINRKCTTTIKGSRPEKRRGYGCSYQDEDYLAFCE